MSLMPPTPEKSQIGDTWVDPISGWWFRFVGESLDNLLYGWVRTETPLEPESKGEAPSAGEGTGVSSVARR